MRNTIFRYLPYLFLGGITDYPKMEIHGNSPEFYPRHTKLKGWQKELKRKKPIINSNMVNLIYADKSLAVKNSFLYLNEVKENVYVYKIHYGDLNTKQEFSLRTRSQILDPDSPSIVFFLAVEFNAAFPDEDLAEKAAEYYSKKFRFKIALRTIYVKDGDSKVKMWKLVNPNVKEPEL